MAAPVNFYADFKGLAAIKKDAGAQDPKALREAARQFESLFTQMMLKSMRQATASVSEGQSLMDNDQSNMYREMFDNQLAMQLSKGRGLGLSDMLVKQLSSASLTSGSALKMASGATPGSLALPNKLSGPAPELASKPPASLLKCDSDSGACGSTSKQGQSFLNPRWLISNSQVQKTQPISQPLTQSTPMPQDIGQPAEFPVVPGSTPISTLINRSIAGPAKPDVFPDVAPDVAEVITTTGIAVPATSTQPKPLALTPAEFIQKMWPHAQAAARELGVDAQTLIAHAALETGWGKFVPCNSDGSCSFNLFGIKANSKWQGQSVAVNTLEYEDGVAVKKRASFRAYESPADSFRDYAALIKNNPRYEAAVGTGDNAGKFASALQQGGYATDPNYAHKLTNTALSVIAHAAKWLKTVASQPLASGSSVFKGGET